MYVACAGGGLLASLPQDKAEACIHKLQKSGYSKAAIIGQVTRGTGSIILHQTRAETSNTS